MPMVTMSTTSGIGLFRSHPFLALHDLLLRVALCLTWHEACFFWCALAPLMGDNSKSSWCALVKALVAQRGHDDSFLAGASVLQTAPQYQHLFLAYRQLHPEIIKAILAHRYTPDRAIDMILAADDESLLRILLSNQRLLQVEQWQIRAAIKQKARRCLALLFSEAAHPVAPRVRIQARSRPAMDARASIVDFGNYPQCLLWYAAHARDDAICNLVLAHIYLLCGPGGALAPAIANAGAAPSGVERIALWAACSGAACGFEPLVARAGTPALTGPCARVSFRAPAHDGQEGELFEDVPLMVVAASCGHARVLEHLSRAGCDFNLCTRRGLTALGEVQRQSPEVREQLLGALRRSGAESFGTWSMSRPSSKHSSRPSSRSGLPLRARSCTISGSSPSHSHASDCLPDRSGSPVRSAIARGDLSSVKAMLRGGAQLGASDIYAATQSGDLEMLAFVQSECASKASDHAEYRKMMRQTAMNIRDAARGGRSHSTAHGSSLRQAGDSMLYTPSRLSGPAKAVLSRH